MPERSRRRGAARKLSLRTAASQRYLARVTAAQRVAAAALRRAIPQARIGRRFQVVLDGLTVSLPATKLPALARLDFVQQGLPEPALPQADRHEPVGDRRR